MGAHGIPMRDVAWGFLDEHGRRDELVRTKENGTKLQIIQGVQAVVRTVGVENRRSMLLRYPFTGSWPSHSQEDGAILCSNPQEL